MVREFEEGAGGSGRALRAVGPWVLRKNGNATKPTSANHTGKGKAMFVARAQLLVVKEMPACKSDEIKVEDNFYSLRL
jgi:hypothetical protein